MTSTYGLIVTSADVQAAVEATITRWVDAYVAEVERQKSLTLPPVRHYDVAAPQTPDEMPAVVIRSGGLIGEPQRHGDGTYDVAFGVGVGIVVSAETRDAARALCQAYTAAIRTLLVQQGSLGGFAEASEWLDEDVTEIAWSTDRSIYGGSVQFAVYVRAAADATAGPIAPPAPDPTTPLNLIAVSATHITTDRSVP